MRGIGGVTLMGGYPYGWITIVRGIGVGLPLWVDYHSAVFVTRQPRKPYRMLFHVDNLAPLVENIQNHPIIALSGNE